MDDPLFNFSECSDTKKLATCCLDLASTLFNINDGNKSRKISCLFIGNSKYEYKTAIMQRQHE